MAVAHSSPEVSDESDPAMNFQCNGRAARISRQLFPSSLKSSYRNVAFGGGGGGEGETSAQRVRKRFFTKSLQIDRPGKRGGESSFLPDKTATPEDRAEMLFVCPATRFREFM
jgi:hypothetical protein